MLILEASICGAGCIMEDTLAAPFLRRHSKSPSYYLRLVVPRYLRDIFSRRIIWKCLHSISYEEASLKAAVWQGSVSRLFILLRSHHHRVTPDQIKILVQHYVSSSLKDCEESRARRSVSDDEREAISCALTDALGETQSQLLSNDYSKMRAVADELLQTHQLPVTSGSPEYQTFCRELLIARQGLLRTEVDRNDGNYWGEHLTSALFAGMVGRQEGGSSAASLKISKPFSEVVTVYFKENQRQPRTDDQIKSGFENSLKLSEETGRFRRSQKVSKIRKSGYWLCGETDA
jgi:hypothetical protein